MAIDTAPQQNDTKPAESTKTAATPKRKPASRAKAKPAARSRTRTASRSRKPAAARTTRTETTTATPRPQAKALNGGQQFVAGVIDAQEKTVTAIVDYQTRAAELSQIPGATAVAEAQAKVLRSVTDTYVSAARAFLK
ncbi:MAG: hypothetical protein ACXW08_14575 [Solirubrobacteraceae bacterium]